MRAVDEDRDRSEAPKATKGLRIATRCVTIEQFVETYHQVCEESAIFIPNTQRPIETVMQFRFDLQDGTPALLGVGTVVEELTTKHNRFNHVGIVVELQRLSRTSVITFDEMLAVRNKLDVPAPVYPRAMTVPIAVVDTKSGRMTTEPTQALRRVPIPLPTAVPSSSPTRTKTIVSLAKKPVDTVRIPAIIAPQVQKRSFVVALTEQITPISVRPAPAPEPKAPAVVTPSVPSTIDDGWDSVATKIEDAIPEPSPHARNDATAMPTEATTTSILEDSLDLSNGSVTVADVDFNSAPIHRELTVLSTVTAVERLVASVAAPDFEAVTAVQSPNGFLLALMRNDGRAAPAILQAEPMQPIVLAQAMERFAPPTIAPATFPAIDVSFGPLDVPMAMPAIDHAAFAELPVGPARRPRRWLVAAGAFAVLICAIVATTVFADRPAASVPPVSTFAPAHESLHSSAVATARDEAPPVAAPKKKPPVRATTPAVANKWRARPISVEQPSPRPRPAMQPLRRPVALKKCKNLGCL